jgi:pimeloyl-ACP methyl ester carboxylesterase
MFISVGDARIYANAFGPRTAPAILALSGWIGTWEDWADPLGLLSADWRTLAYDHRGSGATVAPVESITFETLVSDVFAVLDAYGVKRCVLAAMSAGAAVAFAAALQQPERFSGLVIVDSLNLRDGPQAASQFLGALQKNYAGALDFFANACVPEKDSEHIKRWGRKILDRADPEAAIALFRMGQAIDLRADLARVTQPTLILHGDADVIAPLDSAEWLAGTLPNARLVVLRGAGHVPIMTRPADVAREITAFFADLGGLDPAI